MLLESMSHLPLSRPSVVPTNFDPTNSKRASGRVLPGQTCRRISGTDAPTLRTASTMGMDPAVN